MSGAQSHNRGEPILGARLDKHARRAPESAGRHAEPRGIRHYEAGEQTRAPSSDCIERACGRSSRASRSTGVLPPRLVAYGASLFCRATRQSAVFVGPVLIHHSWLHLRVRPRDMDGSVVLVRLSAGAIVRQQVPLVRRRPGCPAWSAGSPGRTVSTKATPEGGSTRGSGRP
jgi:hypothetical protein